MSGDKEHPFGSNLKDLSLARKNAASGPGTAISESKKEKA
jgi:hypothetical protein